MKLDPLLTPKDCAKLLSVSRMFIWREIDKGRLPVVTHKPARRVLYRVRSEDFHAYLQAYWTT